MDEKPAQLTVWWALFSFRGRLGRQSYFLGAALMLVMQIYILLNVIQANRYDKNEMAVWGFVLIGYWMLSIVAILALSIKRLHDLDLPAWSAILLFMPMANMIFVLFMMLKPGSQKTNQHGPPPFAT